MFAPASNKLHICLQGAVKREKALGCTFFVAILRLNLLTFHDIVAQRYAKN